jgi:hypothetical protein
MPLPQFKQLGFIAILLEFLHQPQSGRSTTHLLIHASMLGPELAVNASPAFPEVQHLNATTLVDPMSGGSAFQGPRCAPVSCLAHSLMSSWISLIFKPLIYQTKRSPGYFLRVFSPTLLWSTSVSRAIIS